MMTKVIGLRRSVMVSVQVDLEVGAETDHQDQAEAIVLLARGNDTLPVQVTGLRKINTHQRDAARNLTSLESGSTDLAVAVTPTPPPQTTGHTRSIRVTGNVITRKTRRNTTLQTDIPESIVMVIIRAQLETG